MRTVPASIVVAMLSGATLAAATGKIVDPDGVPIAGAQICEQVEGAPDRCVSADANGVYNIENPLRASLLVRTSGFVARVIDAAPLSQPVMLQRAAVLRVNVVDGADGRPLAKGKVMIDSPSGRRIGDFVPFNKAGVRISTLDPGIVFVRAEADGYQPGGPVPVELVGGAERAVKVPMTKAGKKPH